MHKGITYDLEIDASTGTLYGVSSSDNGLYSIDKTTGLATLIGTTGLTSFTNLVYDITTATMFATNSGADSFYRIDLATGAATLIGALGGPTNPNGLAVHLPSGALYCVDNSTCANAVNPGPNPLVLTGALVGGPSDAQDTWSDDRMNYITNEVSVTYNAGLQGALAGLAQELATSK